MSLLWVPGQLRENERVTQGVPSLTPTKRASLTHRALLKEKQSRAISDASSKEKAATAPDGERPTTSLEAQLGRPMHSTELMKRLKQLNPLFHFEISRSTPTQMGLYLYSPWTNPNDEKYRHLKFILGFERGIAPEFTVRKEKEVMRWDEGAQKSVPVKVFDGLVMGWRTVLARLLRARLLTQADIDTAFPSPSRDSHNWKGLTS